MGVSPKEVAEGAGSLFNRESSCSVVCYPLTTTMSFTNNGPSRRVQVTSLPHIHLESPSGSEQVRRAPAQLDTDSFPYPMYNNDLPFTSSSTLFQEGSESYNHQFSQLEDISPDDFLQLLNEPQQSQDMYCPMPFMSGPDFFSPSPDTFQVIPPSPPPQTMLHSTTDNMRLIPIYTPSPTSSYTTLSPSPSHESPSSPWSEITTPSSEGSVSPMIPHSSLSRRGSSASLRHHHSPSDSTFYLQPPAVGSRHVRSHSESSMTRPVASQAMLEANQRRRRHDATHRCDECGQTFTAVFSLKRHMQSHSGVRPFVCRVPGCSQAFFNQSDCKRHERSRKRHKGLPFSDSL